MEHCTVSAIQQKTCQHSDRILTRRKALFPSTDDSNSDLGPMSPLSDTNSIPSDYIDNKNSSATFKDYFSSFRTNVNNYVIIHNKSQDVTTLEDTEIEEANLQTEKLTDSPINLQLSSPDFLNTIVCDTPLKESPTKNLKTPHDTSNCTVKVPKLVRKNNGEFLHDIETGTHNFSPTSSPCSKAQKLDSVSKMSKVRTALFPDISLPVQSFYPKSNEKKTEKPIRNFSTQEKTAKKKSSAIYLCSRRLKKRYGQINAGVRHKIKKPKQKFPVKINAKKAAMSVMQSAHLVEFIKEMNILQTKTTPKLIKAIDNKDLFINKKKKSEDNINILEEDKKNIEREENSINSNRKFFKSSLTKSAVSSNVGTKIMEEDKIIYDTLDFNADNEQDLIVPSLDKIIDTLEEENLFPPNQIVLKASNRVSDSDNSILFHHPHGHSKYTNCKERKRKLDDKENESVELLLSPTSQMCDMASGLAINSPKRAKLNITSIIDKTQDTLRGINVFNKISSGSLEMEKQKLFPIFYSSHNSQNKEVKSSSSSKTANMKKWKGIPEDQMLLDAGQRRFGFTQCSECELIYHMGDPNEEIMHMDYHNSKHVLNFKGWKNENVVGSLVDAKIIKISPGDSKIWWKKVRDVIEIMNRDLGYYEMELDTDNSCVFLYIKNKTIAGCIVAEPKLEAFKMLSCFEGIDVCSTQSYPVKCGISRIWVSQPNRKQGIATAIMDCVRANFSYGYFLRRDEMAFSSPSELGKTFAKKYFQTDNYLIYTS